MGQNVNLISLLVREEGALGSMNVVITSPIALMVVMKSTVVSYCCPVTVIGIYSTESILLDYQICLVGILTCCSVVMVTALHLPSIVMVTTIVVTGLMS